MNGKTKRAQESEGGAKVNKEMLRDNEQAKRNEQGSKDRGVGMWTWKWTGIKRKRRRKENIDRQGVKRRRMVK